jgi:hypothetical protein
MITVLTLGVGMASVKRHTVLVLNCLVEVTLHLVN